MPKDNLIEMIEYLLLLYNYHNLAIISILCRRGKKQTNENWKIDKGSLNPGTNKRKKKKKRKREPHNPKAVHMML